MNSDSTQDTRTDDTVKAEEGALTRRQVLTVAVKTAAGAGAGLLLLLPMVREAAHANAAHANAAHPAAPVKPADTSTWTSLGKADTFLLNQPKRTELPNGDVLYVTRLTASTLAVVSAKCTHRGCEVGYNKDAGQFVCPCHGAVFATGGKNIHGTRRSPDEALPALPSVPNVQKKGLVLADLKAVPAPALIPGH